jgi:hypothetical protein
MCMRQSVCVSVCLSPLIFKAYEIILLSVYPLVSVCVSASVSVCNRH